LRQIQNVKWIYNCITPINSSGKKISTSYGSKTIYQKLLYLLKSKSLSKDELETLQNEKLKILLNSAYKHVPYYRNLFIEKKLNPDDIKSVKDLYKFPPLTKQILRSNPHEYFINSNLENTKYNVITTSGSTGLPLKTFVDQKSNYISWALYLRFLLHIGYNWGDRVLKIWGQSQKPSQSTIGRKIERYIRHHIRNEYLINSFHFNLENRIELVKNIISLKPDFIRGYVTPIKFLAKTLIDLDFKIKLKGIITTSEILTPDTIKLIETAFDSSVYDQYGCGEIMSIAFECPQHSGLHISSEHVIVELIEHEEDPSIKLLCITDLDNFVQPLIRYVVGDISSPMPNERPCSCGMNHPKITPIKGRTYSLIKGKNGRLVSSIYFAFALSETKIAKQYEVLHWQIYQNNDLSLNWKIISKKSILKNDLKILQEYVKKGLGEVRINYIIKVTDQIENILSKNLLTYPFN